MKLLSLLLLFSTFISALARVRPAWQVAADEKVKFDNSKIREEWRLSSDDIAKAQDRPPVEYIETILDRDTRFITSLDTPELENSIRNRSLSAVAVVTAFCKRAAFAHQLV